MSKPYEYSPNRPTADQMDDERQEKAAYEYLCRLEEAKDWMEQCLQSELPPIMEMEERLRNGVLLARIGNYIAPKVVQISRIYDKDEIWFKEHGLHFRHTDNIIHWFKAMESVGLKRILYPETTDVYDKKNMPKAVFCLHALSIYLHKKFGGGPEMKSFFGKAEYTKEEISFMAKELAKYGITMPNFSKIGGMLADEMPIDEVALHAAVIAINEEVENGTAQTVLTSLKNPNAHMTDVIDDYASPYFHHLRGAKDRKSVVKLPEQITNGHHNNEDDDAYNLLLTREEIQANVDKTNVKEALIVVNQAIQGDDSKHFMIALRNPVLQLPTLDRNVGEFYHHEFKIIYAVKRRNLDIMDVQSAVNVLNAVIAINDAVDKRNEPLLQQCLSDDSTGLNDVRYENMAAYMRILNDRKLQKENNDLLTLDEICACIEEINESTNTHNQKMITVDEINNLLSLSANDDNGLLVALLENPNLELQNVFSLDGEHYFYMLKKLKEERLKVHKLNENDGLLRLEDIQDIILATNQEKVRSTDKSMDAIALNKLVDSNADDKEFLELLILFGRSENLPVNEANLHEYRKKIQELQKARLINDRDLPKEEARLDMKLETVLEEPDFEFDDQIVAHKFSNVPSECSLQEFERLERLLALQGDDSTLRADGNWYPVETESKLKFYINIHNGEICNQIREDENLTCYLTPNEISEIIRKTNESNQKNEQTRIDELHYKQNEDAIIKVQSFFRMWRDRTRYRKRLEYLNAQEESAKKIQNCFRNKQAKKNRHSLNDPSKATLASIQNFLPLLTNTDADYNEEIENEQLKRNVLEKIRRHKQYEADLEAMDIKIGLLVKNKTTLEEVIAHKKQLKSYKDGGAQSPDGLNSNRFSFLSKTGREKLLCYQHLVYLLQTKPIYLSKLLFIVPERSASEFIEKTVLPVFNSATQPREQYLLLKFFRSALKYEIETKINSVHDVINGQSLVLTIIANYNRNVQSDKMLKDLLQPLLLRLLKDEKSVTVNTNPIEIYQKWRKDDENAKHLPENVTNEEALKYPEVKKCLEDSIAFLEEWVSPFVDEIVKTTTKLPYSIRYMSKMLRQQLSAKFPKVPDKDILKAVGSLVYSRFIGSCIISPELFNIFDEKSSVKLTEDDKKKLGSVAKMLQFASSNMGFGEENAHLEPMNSFIIKCHGQFKQFFAKVCNVDDAEKYFGMDEFSDYTLMTKPTVVITIGQLISLHQLLLNNRPALVSDDKSEQLDELLNDFDFEPSIKELIGEVDNATRQRAENTEICLTLINKFASRVSPEEAEHRALFLKTKIYLIDVMSCQIASTLLKLLHSPTSIEAEDKHNDLINSRTEQNEKMNLLEKKQLILRNLETLEKYGLVSKSNEYQAIIRSLAEDVRSQKAYREQRRQEHLRLEESLKKLDAKSKSYQDQLDSFTTYLQSCIDSLPAHTTKKADQVPWQKTKHDSMMNKTVKISASKMKDKKILISIGDGHQNNQFKNINFEFKCKPNVDFFEVTIKSPGGKLETFDLNFPDLLQKQYEDETTTILFDRMKINVNMLIFFLNKKFYSVRDK